MESAQELKIAELKNAERKDAIEQWLHADCGIQPVFLHPMGGDASFRRYFRIHARGQSFVVMDAPPSQENCRPYAAISKALRQMGLSAPEIIHSDLEQGFLLITDFGDLTYLKTLNSNNVIQLYNQALNDLAILQSCQKVDGHTIPLFTADFMWKEWALHKEWVLGRLLRLSTPLAEQDLDNCYALLVNSAISQPQVFMHRDYHSANLMALANGGVGILDFQDAFLGPVTYDVVSLLRDCYLDWPREQVRQCALAYLKKLHGLGVLNHVDDQQFMVWFDWMGMQRHLKALLTFARKHVRDHQSRYLNYIPRTLGYLLTVSQAYPEFAALHEYLRVTVQPAFERVKK